MMFGFSGERRRMLEEEVRRIGGELGRFGALRAWEVGDLARGRVGPASELELVIVQETDEPFRRRADFWVGHLRPQVGTRFVVYTPEEAEALEEVDPVLVAAQRVGEELA